MADSADTRRSVYLLLSAVALAAACAKVFGAELLYEPSRHAPPVKIDDAGQPVAELDEAGRPKDAYGSEPSRAWPKDRPVPSPAFSSNDKSRWATVRALVDEGTYVIGQRVYPHPTDPKKSYYDDGIIRKGGGYESLDVVMNPETKQFYSSKPPLMPTLVAGEYWVLKKLLGWEIVRDRWLVIPTIVFTVNVLPFAVYLLLLARLIEATGQTDFGRLLAFTVAALGTYLVTFAGTLNNHSPAAYCVLFAAYPVLRAMAENRALSTAGYLCCGFFAGFAVTFELPAASFLVALGVPLLIAHPRKTLLGFAPAALLPLAALLACNYAAMGRFTPAYGEFGGPWYNYEGSHWSKIGTAAGKGIDFNNEPTTIYAFHLLLGHHGWFSLTPVWFLALGGLVGMAMRSAASVRELFARPKGTGWTPELFAAMTLVVSVTVFAFYLTRTMSYNYGGFTSGPRWLFWLIPLWVLALPRAADVVGRTMAGRGLCALLVGFSVFSVLYPAVNPWRHPWILNLMEFTGLLRY